MPHAVIVKSLTPVLYVEAVEPCLGFWVDRLGFAVTASVPAEGGAGIGFAIVARDGAEVMLQTHASLAADMPAVGPIPGPTVLYVQVADLDAAVAAVDPASIVVPRRRTFYGADEVFVRTPGGHVIGLATFPATAA